MIYIQNTKKLEKLKIENFLLKIISSNHNEPNTAIVTTKKVIITHYKNFSRKVIINTYNDYFLNCCFRKNDNRIVAISRQSGCIDIFDTKKGFLLRNIAKNMDICRTLNFLENGVHLIYGSTKGNVIIYDILTQQQILNNKISNNLISSVRSWPNNCHIYISASYDGLIKINDIRLKKPSAVSIDYGCPIESLEIMKDINKVVCIGGNSLKILDLKKLGVEYVFKKNKAITNLEISGNNLVLFSGLDSNIYFIKSHNFFKTNLLLNFEKNIISYSSLSSDLIVGFTNEVIRIKNRIIEREVRKENINKKNKKKKNRINSNIFYIPTKKINKLQILHKNVSLNNFKDRGRTNYLTRNLYNTSINCMIKNEKFKQIFYTPFKDNRVDFITLILNEIIQIGNSKKIIDKLDEKDFCFFMEKIIKSNNLNQIQQALWLNLKITELYLSVFIFSKSYLKIKIYIQRINFFFNLYDTLIGLEYFFKLKMTNT